MLRRSRANRLQKRASVLSFRLVMELHQKAADAEGALACCTFNMISIYWLGSLALLWQIDSCRFPAANPFSAVRASLRWRSE